MNNITLIKDESLFKTPYLNVAKTTYMDAKGKTREWFWVSRSKLMTAVLIAVTVEDRLLVTQEYRIPIKEYEWGFPAGLMQSGDSVESCAKRELLEETGYHIDKIIVTSPTLLSSAGLTNETCYIVRGTAIEYDRNKSLSDEKEIIVHQMTSDEVNGILSNRTNFISARAYPIMYEFAKYGKL